MRRLYRALVRLAALSSLLIFEGCAMYNHAFPVVAPPTSDVDLRIVQADDYGSFWDTAVAQKTLADVQAFSETQNTLVVLFIHGWHHNAAADDEDLQASAATLAALHAELAKPERGDLRERMTGSRDFRLVGIYVGWRGRSLPGLLDYLTFWGRKNAAERTGDGDVSEFVLRLQRIFLRANQVDPRDPDRIRKPFTGLVTVGHSFGAQVLWKTISRELEEPLAERAPCLADVLDPTLGPRDVRERTPINGLGDLNILLNPALEAYQYARVDALYRQLSYPSGQTPQVVVFSADNDDARKIWFPLARAVTSPFRPRFRPDYQGPLYGVALGELPSQRTHVLGLAPAGRVDSLQPKDYDDETKILDFDFTGETAFGGIELKPDGGAAQQAGRVAYSPVMVVQTHDKIIDGHGGIFQPGFREFVSKYVAYIEGKRLLLRKRQLERREPPQEHPAHEPLCMK